MPFATSSGQLVLIRGRLPPSQSTSLQSVSSILSLNILFCGHISLCLPLIRTLVFTFTGDQETLPVSGSFTYLRSTPLPQEECSQVLGIETWISWGHAPAPTTPCKAMMFERESEGRRVKGACLTGKQRLENRWEDQSFVWRWPDSTAPPSHCWVTPDGFWGVSEAPTHTLA